MRIAVTGATGFVGTRLVPLLSASGAQLLLVGRDRSRLMQLFPGLPACCYDQLAEEARDFDLLIHLAVANTDSDLPEAEIRDVNVGLLLKTAQAAKLAGVSCFLNVSSVHALAPNNRSAYARTKREAAQRLMEIEGMSVRTLYLPVVYGNGWSGKLTFLGHLPSWLSRLLFRALASVYPTVHVSQLAAFILDYCKNENRPEIVLSDGQENNIVYRFVSRAVDLIFAISVAVFFWWGLALIWATIRLQSPGPGIFAQDRIGKNGCTFTCYKFRTMRQDTPQDVTNRIPADAVTTIGRLLRRTKLDELPQIWNIFQNEMSLVGPRPCLPIQAELIEARRQHGVLRLKPGISGFAQINGVDMSQPETLAHWDARYLALQSLSLDMCIIAATAIGRGSGDRTERNAHHLS
ncbi:MAG: sugar transferase [Xanthobacteraceae bacterium]|uniref:sugar transferase n=1 Tax=Pseudolabrys sp. TaxID=1960880 RepID=UPI003D13981C